MCLAVWNLIGVVASYPVVVSPWAVVSGAVDILLNSSAVTMKNIAIWGNTSTSVVEIWTGLMFALALALITVRFVPSANLSNLLSRAVFGVSDASALLLAMIVIYWRMNSYIPNLSFRFTTFHTALFVASLCYLPLLTAMCSLREPVSFDRVIIGLLGALPFAFIGMIYGEAFGSTSGLAFTMINAGASSRRIDQVVYCVFLITYFGLFSFVLEWLAFRKQE
jgi:ABC-type nitrate/sulfonate/bicarbonate transport system permease component